MKLHDAIAVPREIGSDFDKWLERPDVCNPSNLTTRLEMAAGTFVWPDAFQFRGQDTREFAILRDGWSRQLTVNMDACDGARFGPAVRRYKRELESAFARPRAITAIQRMLDGTEKEQDVALTIIRLAPSHTYYERVAQLARAGDMLARRAMIEIDGLPPREDLPPNWATWLQQTLDDPQPAALDALLATAAGTSVPGAPETTISIEVRRAAARIARWWRETTRDGRVIISKTISTLATDPDTAIRREGVVMLEPNTDDNVELLAVIAKTDAEPRIRLIAYVKLPKREQDNLPIDSRP
jgi:hypothetical protein